MLKKLLKYDLINIYKFLIIFYSLALFFGILTRIFLSIENSLILNIIGQICNGAMISMLFSIVINNFMRLWVRFKQNFYGDESYLIHTLPVEKKSLYNSKLLCAIISLFTSILVVVLTLFIAHYSKENLEAIKILLFSITNNSNGLLYAFLFIIFLEFLNMLQCGFTGIILGHRMNNVRVGYSVLFGFIANMVSSLIVLFMIFMVGFFDKDIMNLIFTNSMISFNSFKIIAYMSIIMYVIILIIGYFVNIKLFKKGVNVE